MNDRAGARPAEGFFFEDYAVGRRFRHATPRTVTAADQSLYIALTGARHPVHGSVPLARALGHRDAPLDDLLVFNMAVSKTVPDISYNAIANLGYADVRFSAPVYPGDTITSASEVIGTKPNSDGKSGLVYVRSRAENQDGTEVLSWSRWVMVKARQAAAGRPVVPELPKEVPVSRFAVPSRPITRALSAATASPRAWEDYEPGQAIDHPSGATIEEAEHMLATRLYQNTARIHLDALHAKATRFGRRLVYGGHVISICRALSYDGLENAFAMAAIHGCTHANPSFAGDTLYCRSVITERQEIPGRRDLGALRVRMIGIRNLPPAELPRLPPGEKHAAVVLELDCSVLIARRQ